MDHRDKAGDDDFSGSVFVVDVHRPSWPGEATKLCFAPMSRPSRPSCGTKVRTWITGKSARSKASSPSGDDAEDPRRSIHYDLDEIAHLDLGTGIQPVQDAKALRWTIDAGHPVRQRLNG